jgi:hypothetical protein
MLKRLTVLAVLAGATLALAVTAGSAGTGLSFTNTPLLTPQGDSEPAISIGPSSAMAITGLQWLSPFHTNLWTGTFGSTPTLFGAIDSDLGRGVEGGEDADVDIGSTGTLHVSTLLLFRNPAGIGRSLGVSAISCPSSDPTNCTKKIIDTAGADRQWVTSDGKHVWISYHDSGDSTLIHVQRSDDDGVTWKMVGDPIVGQGSVTGGATFNNDQGPIVADTKTHVLYDVYAAGEASVQKGTTANFNNIYVSRSYDGGVTWSAQLVYHAPLNTALNNVFPSLAADPVTGDLYAVWSDQKHVFVSSSPDGINWSPAQAVNVAPANTVVMPWLAAQNGTVDVVYYGTDSSSKDDPSAVWHVYIAQSTSGGSLGSFAQSLVDTQANHVGPICTQGIACSPGTRNLLDLFEDAIDPASGKVGVIYTNDLLTKDSSGNPLPQVVLAQQQ